MDLEDMQTLIIEKRIFRDKMYRKPDFEFHFLTREGGCQSCIIK